MRLLLAAILVATASAMHSWDDDWDTNDQLWCEHCHHNLYTGSCNGERVNSKWDNYCTGRDYSRWACCAKKSGDCCKDYYKLDGGAIAGIVIACVAIIACCCACAFFAQRKNNKPENSGYGTGAPVAQPVPSAPPAPQTVTVTVPANAQPGQTAQFILPDGRTVQAVIPPGVAYGQPFQIQV